MKKRILVTGVNSYIGNSFRTYMEQFAEDYTVDGASVRNDAWKELNFSGYDCVFDVAGIAHADTGHVSEETKQRYYAVNRDLTVALAEKAKREGARQFIFMSSAIVYGDSAPVIYGKGSRGNYPTLSKMAQKLPVFPLVDNCRSMLYVGNLVEFVRLMIKNEEEGFFFPQNAQYSNTSHLVQMIAAAHGKKILLVKGCTPPLRLLSHATGIVNKAFGSLAYDMAMSVYKEEYRKYSLEESIRLTEG